MYIKLFSEVSKKDVSEVGGKAASLGEMTKAGVPVPPGFVLTTDANKEFYKKEFPVSFQEEILKAFDSLNTERVAVRSSAVAEDSSSSSWAGQLESYLNIKKEDLIEKIKDCWNSINSQSAQNYAYEHNVSKDRLLVAVVIQKMVESESSGVMFTINPITKDESEIMIEAGFGLGEMLVQGMITPDNFLLDKKTLEIKSKTLSDQDKMLIFQDGENKEVSVPDDKKGKPALSDEEVKSLAKLGVQIEEHYTSPQDIEWGLEEGNFYILQSRPITTL